MGNVVIVAIPEEEDYVWKISSEKVPHMTLLNLGDALSDEDVARVMGYIEHAANTSLRRFGLSVDRRGTLGKDDADVVFFNPEAWDLHQVQKFRTFLLREDKIHTAVDLTPQFEGWLPHLTLGYPTTPAKPDPREYPGVHYVAFNKIALWVDDFAGPEFELQRYGSDHEVMMSALGGELEHHGVKGMKWGVRKEDRGSGLTMYMIKNGASKDSIGTVKRGFARTAGTARYGIAATNRRYKGIDLTKDAKARKRYEAEVHSVMERALNKGVINTLAAAGVTAGLVAIGPAAAVAGSTAAAGAAGLRLGYRVHVVVQARNEVKTVRNLPALKHEDGDPVIEIIFEYDEMGLIKDLKLDGIEEDGPTDIQHDSVNEHLEHHGIKGMKWGIRRTREQRAAAKQAETQKHADHARARELMKKRVSELSNEELSFINNRRNLEANYAKLNPAKSARRKKKIENHLKTLDLIEKTFTATQQPVAQKIIKTAHKKSSSPAAKKVLKTLLK